MRSSSDSLLSVRIREVGGSSPSAPVFLMPWSGSQGIFLPRAWLILKVKRLSDLTVR